MGSRSAGEVLQLPVRLRGVRLGHPVDLLLLPDATRVLGFVVLCGDGTRRFLPFAAAQVGEGEIAVGSALMLLEDVAFYRSRSVSFRALLGGTVGRNGREAGTLRDLELGAAGVVEAAVVEGGSRRLDPAGLSLAPARASAA